jgi:hypothetical protein
MKTTGILKVDFQVNFILNETEIRALDALAGYGIKPFLDVFYEKLGKSYMEPYADGLTSLFEKIQELRQPIAAMDELKKDLTKVRQKFNT